MTSSPPLRLSGLTKRFARLAAVDAIDLTIERGEVVALLGPNGAGKSTTIDLALGLSIRPRAPPSCSAAHPGRPSSPAASARCCRAARCCRPRRSRRASRSSLRPTAIRCPSRRRWSAPACTEFARQKVAKLSGGQLQRARFAVAIVSDPELLFLDEPTAAMDVEARRAFWTSMHEFTDTGRTVVFATHYLDEADTFADRIVMMSAGRIVADGTPSEVKAVVSGRSHRVLAPSTRRRGSRSASGASRACSSSTPAATHLRVATTDSDAVLRLVLAERSDAHDIEVTARHHGRRLPRPDHRDGPGGLPMNIPYVLLESVRQLRKFAPSSSRSSSLSRCC